MEVCLSHSKDWEYSMYNSSDEICIEVDDTFYNEYLKTKKNYDNMQSKLIPLLQKYNIVLDNQRKERKIEALKKEITKLKGEIRNVYS